MKWIPLSRSFKDLSIIAPSQEKDTGSAIIYFTGFSYVILFDTSKDQEQKEIDFDMFLISPFTTSYAYIDGYHIVDLMYYRQFTAMKQPPKIRFIDPTQDPSITLFFGNEDIFYLFQKSLSKNFCLKETNGSVFYIARFSTPELYSLKPIVQATTVIDKDLFFATFTNFTTQIIIEKDPLPKGIDIFKDIKTLKQSILKYSLPECHFARAFTKLLGIGDYPVINARVIEVYSSIKKQWKEIFVSQAIRCSEMMNTIANISNGLQERNTILQKFVQNPQILSSTFNIVMSIVQVYHYMSNKLNDLIDMSTVFISVFADGFYFNANFEPMYQFGTQEIVIETFEATVFISMIFILEWADIKETFLTYPKEEELIKPIMTIISRLTPSVISVMESRGKVTSGSLNHDMSTLFAATSLPRNVLAEMWLSGLAMGSILDFVDCFATASFFISFPNELQNEDPINLEESIKAGFQFWGDRKLIPIAYKLYTLMFHKK